MDFTFELEDILIANNLVYKSQLQEIYLLGNLLGGLDDYDNYMSREKIIQGLKNKNTENILKIIKNCVGKFSFIIKEGARVYIINSFASPGLYLIFDNKYILTTNEKYVFNLYYKKNGLTDDILDDYLTGNHLSFRHPFTFFGEFDRIPGGHYININDYKINGNHETSSLLKFSREVYTDFDIIDKLHKRLGAIIQSYHYNYGKGKLNLAFSGGLDSSIIMAIMIEKNIDFDSYFIEYNGKNSIDSLISHQIAARLGKKINFLPSATSKITNEQLHKHMHSGFFQMNNLKYIYAPTITGYFLENKNLISGQNADSLYAIDTFLPGTEVTGVNRYHHIINGLQHRLVYNKYTLKESINNKEIDKTLLNKIMQYYLMNIGDEHVILNNNFKKELGHLKLIKLDRYKKLFPKHNKIEDIIQTDNYNTALRYIKILRNNINTAQNYNEMGRSYGLTRSCPFNEGPIYDLFINYKIKIYDIMSPKTLFEILFEKITTYSHRDLIETIVNQNGFLNKKLKSDHSSDLLESSLLNLNIQKLLNKCEPFFNKDIRFKKYTKNIKQNPSRFMNLCYLVNDAKCK